MLNKILLIGNVGKDPEIRYTTSGTAIATLSLATTRKHKDNAGKLIEETAWHRCVLFGKLAELTEKYVKKGAKLYLEGRINYSKWQDKDGKENYTTEIVVNEMLMLSKKEFEATQETQKDNFDYDDDILS